MASLELQPPDLGFVPNYQERTDDASPSTAGFGMDGGRATMILDVTDAELDKSLVDLLGYASVDRASTKIKRKCPKAHPRFPWLYCSRISQVQGLGKATRVPGNSFFEANALTSYATWDRWRMTVEFEPRPYFVLNDASIPNASILWTQEDSTHTANNYSLEWLRYTDYEVLPKPELITGQQGQMAFYTASGAKPGNLTAGIPVAGIPFPGFLRMTVAQAEINMAWYTVPYIYINSPNSRLVSYVGKVNQFDWFGFKAGELLYLGFSAKKYTPVSPDFQPDSVAGFASLPARMADIVLHFLYTKRPGTDVPTLANGNKIPAGHNLVPWLRDRTFRYVSSLGASATANDGPPLFFSRPFELLFSNPDS